MSEVLAFDLEVAKPGFTLKAAAELPLSGITAISGPSGSGKTTLLRALAGLEPTCQGQIHFRGADWRQAPAARRGVGYVFQEAMLFPHLSVAENLAYGAIRRRANQALLDGVIEALDLRPLLARAPATLSGGEARRVALGRALASAPAILMMDEPLTGLDQARKTDLMPYVARAVASFGVPALYVTHAADEIAFLADRTMFLDKGQITGRIGATARLIGQVVNAAPGQVQVALGHLRLWLSGQGEVGETWAIPLGQDVLVARADPGETSAALCLPGHLVAVDPERGRCRVEIAGQHVALPWRGAAEHAPEPGAEIWILLPEVVGRPVQRDPQHDSHPA